MTRPAMFGAVFLVFVAVGCGSSDSSNPSASPAELGFVEHPCTVELPEGFTQDDVRCATLTVLQDRDDPDGPRFNVEFGVVFARQQPALPDPLVYIPGGPGASALEFDFGFDALNFFTPINQTRDLVYFDPRGTGISTPDMRCPERAEFGNETLFEPGGFDELSAARLEGMRVCRERLLADGLNLSHFHSASISADLAEGLEALGYESANFWGPSYGGRVAQTLMRDYPELVRSVLLDAPAMPDVRSSAAALFQRSLDAVLEDCAASPTCSSNFPNLEAEFYAVLESLNQNPIQVDVEFQSETETLFVSGDRFLAGMENAFGSNSLIPLIPAAIHATFEGSFGIVESLAPSLVGVFDSLAWGHNASVLCAEDEPFWTEAQRAQSNEGVNPAILAAYESSSEGVCDFWDAEPRPTIAGESVISDIPTLIFQGEYDFPIPPRNAEQAAENLSNSQYVLFPAFGHVVLVQDFNADGTTCGHRIFRHFLDDPNVAVDTTCVDALPAPF